jgi:hypothetical protein
VKKSIKTISLRERLYGIHKTMPCEAYNDVCPVDLNVNFQILYKKTKNI